MAVAPLHFQCSHHKTPDSLLSCEDVGARKSLFDPSLMLRFRM